MRTTRRVLGWLLIALAAAPLAGSFIVGHSIWPYERTHHEPGRDYFWTVVSPVAFLAGWVLVRRERIRE